MGESVRPTRLDDGITDAMIDRWEANGDKPVLCAALIQRMQAATNEVIDRKEDKIFVPKVLLDLYEISASRHENTIDQFQEFCAKYNVDPTKYLEFNQKLAKGKPVEFERMRTLMHIVLIILCEKLKIDKKIFPSEGTGGLFVVGGLMYAEAEKLAKVLYAKVA
ncbi:hypothetical protein IT413_04115 [Candidatus Peregrinibacteria bacterium]|nr:hypothetical protein [Candidatus Peregrinibacteria bacterium]